VNLLESKSVQARPGQNWLVLLCLLLLSISAAAQAHLHPDDLAASVKGCVICHVAHSSPQIAVAVQLDVVLATTAYLIPISDSGRQSSFELGWHFSRPPPPA